MKPTFRKLASVSGSGKGGVLRRIAIVVVLAIAGLLGTSPGFAQPSQSLQQIYLYKSPATAAFFKANESDYDALLAHWRLYLKRYGNHVREVSRTELLASLPPGVLILGSALLLDDNERSAIERFAQGGGSVLGTWATGARDGMGVWRGWDFLSQVFDVTIAGEISREEEQWFMMPFGDGPVTWPLPAGRRMYLGKVAENLLRIDAKLVAARYMDWNRTPDLQRADGAIAYSERQGARRVYLGFAESAWDYHTRDDVNQMLDAMIAWLRREPRVFKAAWPHGKVAAQLLEMDTEAQFHNAVNFANQLDAAGIKGTFYCLTSEALKHPDLVRDLFKRGHEIAYHADLHVGFRGEKPPQQEQRIQNMQRDMRAILGGDLSSQTGFRAPTESYDTTTEMLLRKYGLKHHAADPSSTEDRLPFFSKSEKHLGSEEALVVLPRTNYDDISFRMAAMTQERIQQHLLRDFDHVVEMGAFGLLSVHSQNYGEIGPLITTMPALFMRIAQVRDKVWLARGDQIAQWWRQRERVTVRGAAEGDTQSVQVQVRPPGGPEGVSVIITHAYAGHPPLHVESLTPYAPPVELRPIDAYRSALVLGSSAAGTYRFRVRF